MFGGNRNQIFVPQNILGSSHVTVDEYNSAARRWTCGRWWKNDAIDSFANTTVRIPTAGQCIDIE
jgi:hypothetical protein